MVAKPAEKQGHELPEWMEQRLLVQSGEKAWDDFTFEERTCKGWLLPYLLEIETSFYGRWNYWMHTLENGALLENNPIPKIHFMDITDSETSKMLIKCMDHHSVYASSVRLPDFFEWILWGFGDPHQEERPRLVNETVNEHWYRTFNLGLLIQNPHDYLGNILADSKAGRTYWNNPNAFFPTPHPICEMMARMNFEAAEGDTRALSVCDPCVGTGRMLMHSSNFSVNLYGQDIDRACILACTINGYLYMPWLIRPAPWLSITESLVHGDSLKPTFIEEPIQEEEPQPKQLRLF